MKKIKIGTFFVKESQRILDIVNNSSAFKDKLHQELMDTITVFDIRRLFEDESNIGNVSYAIVKEIGASKMLQAVKSCPRSLFRRDYTDSRDLKGLTSIDLGIIHFSFKQELERFCEEYNTDLEELADIFYSMKLGPDFKIDGDCISHIPKHPYLTLYINEELFEDYLYQYIYPVYKEKKA